MIKKIAYISFSVLLIIFGMIVCAVYGGAHHGGRMLTEPEQEIAVAIYGDAVDLNFVRLTFDTPYAIFGPVSLGNVIHINSSWSYLDSTAELTEKSSGHHVLIHELGHVYQYQHRGWGYLVNSASAQTLALVMTGSRNGAYEWRDAYRRKLPWEDWNVEAEAQALADYEFVVLKKFATSEDGTELVTELGCFVPLLIPKYCLHTEETLLDDGIN